MKPKVIQGVDESVQGSPSKAKNPPAIIGLVLGLASVLFYWVGMVPILGIIFSLTGWVKSTGPGAGIGRWQSFLGLALSSLYFVLYLDCYGHIDLGLRQHFGRPSTSTEGPSSPSEKPSSPNEAPRLPWETPERILPPVRLPWETAQPGPEGASSSLADFERQRLERDKLGLERERLEVEKERLALEKHRQRETEAQAFRERLDRIFAGPPESIGGLKTGRPDIFVQVPEPQPVLPPPKLPWETRLATSELELAGRIKQQCEVLKGEYPSFQSPGTENGDFQRWVDQNRKLFDDLCNLAEADVLFDLPRFIWYLVTKRDTSDRPGERRSAPPADFSRAIRPTPLQSYDGDFLTGIAPLGGILLPSGNTLTQQEVGILVVAWEDRCGGNLFSGVKLTRQEAEEIGRTLGPPFGGVPLTPEQAEAIVISWGKSGVVLHFTFDVRLSSLPEAVARKVWVYRVFNDRGELNNLKTSQHTGANVKRYRVFVAIPK